MRPIRTKLCQTCGAEFSYEIGRGMDRRHCSKICQGAWHRANKLSRVGNCRIQNCIRKATRADGLCETHWYRRYRTGTTDDRAIKEFFLASNGYYLAYSKGHPVARHNGQLYLHRKILWDAIGPGPHKCHWCKCDIDWHIKRGKSRLVVDHVDGIKTNNTLINLVPSCHQCNIFRGSFMSWARKHRDDPFLLSLFRIATSEAA